MSTSMDPKGKRHPTRCTRKSRKIPDLNALPSEIREQEESSTPTESQPLDTEQRAVPVTIDVEELDDDVIVSSPRTFAEAKFNANRTRVGEPLVDLGSDAGKNKRKRTSSNRTIVNCDVYINLEGSSSSNQLRDFINPFPTAPKEATFNCPICMGPFAEEVSTKCGHIFCKKCIKSAIAVQAKCPTCRKKVVARDLIRVFLPATE